MIEPATYRWKKTQTVYYTDTNPWRAALSHAKTHYCEKYKTYTLIDDAGVEYYFGRRKHGHVHRYTNENYDAIWLPLVTSTTNIKIHRARLILDYNTNEHAFFTYVKEDMNALMKLSDENDENPGLLARRTGVYGNCLVVTDKHKLWVFAEFMRSAGLKCKIYAMNEYKNAYASSEYRDRDVDDEDGYW
jgi:hypothetical protein